MQSIASNVTTYFNEVPDARRELLTKLRHICAQTLIGYQESMDYGMPSYKKNGKVEVSFLSQKNHISLYVLKKEVVDSYRTELVGASIGKGCIRYSKPERLVYQLLNGFSLLHKRQKR